MYVKYKSQYDNPENLELLVELPLDDEKFTSLQENDLKIRDLHATK